MGHSLHGCSGVLTPTAALGKDCTALLRGLFRSGRVPCLMEVIAGTREHSMALPAEYRLGTPGYFRGAARARLLRHGRGAARAVLSCAGAYVAGAAGSNACPAGSARIETEEACRTAAAAAGKFAGSPFVQIDASSPRGCYYSIATSSTSFNYAWFNPHQVGIGDSVSRLLCAVTSGAPPPSSPIRARAYTGACSGTVHAQRRAASCMRILMGILCGVLYGVRGKRISRSCASARLGCGRVPQHRAASGCAGCLTERYSAVLSRYSRGTLWHSWEVHRMRWAVHGRVGHTLLCFVRYGTVGYSLGETGRPQRAVYTIVRCGMTSRRGRGV